MRITGLVLIILLTHKLAFGQITGNPNVRDLKAIQLDSAVTNLLVGEWRWLRFEESRREGERVVEHGPSKIVFHANGTILVDMCRVADTTCAYRYQGTWTILENNTVQLTFPKVFKNNKLEGPWVIYKLTSTEMTMVRIITSSGDWRVQHEFQK